MMSVYSSKSLSAIISEAPAKELADKMQPFAGLIGDWSLEIVDIAPDGSTTASTGTWHFYEALQP